MRQQSILWQWAGFAFVTFGGTILHFIYDWTGGNILVSPFSGMNESTWEHMKLLYWPLLLFAVFQYFFYREPNYWYVKLAATVLGIGLIPVLFYAYNGMFGKSPDWVNISIFYVAAAAAFGFEWWAFRKNLMLWKYPQLGLGALIGIGILFGIFTFAPPQIPLFQDPVTGRFGI